MFRSIVLFASMLILRSIQAAPPFSHETAQALIPQLNSDRIIHFFGNYGVDQISMKSNPFGEWRVSNLYSIHDEQKFMRTLDLFRI